jgi:heme-degrading monooxygenase HmoA
MIARTWRGATRAEDADRYLDYLQSTGLDAYQKTSGNRGVIVLRRIIGGRAEFLLISFWESESAIRRFAGDDISAAVFYSQDDAFLIDRERHVDHFEVVFRADARG